MNVDPDTEDFHKLKTIYIHTEESEIKIVGERSTFYGWTFSSRCKNIADNIKQKLTVTIQEEEICKQINIARYESYTKNSQMCGTPMNSQPGLVKVIKLVTLIEIYNFFVYRFS